MPNSSSCTAPCASFPYATRNHSLVLLLLRLLIMHSFLRIYIANFIEQWRNHLSSRLNLVVSDQLSTILLSLATKVSKPTCEAHATRRRMRLTLYYLQSSTLTGPKISRQSCADASRKQRLLAQKRVCLLPIVHCKVLMHKRVCCSLLLQLS